MPARRLLRLTRMSSLRLPSLSAGWGRPRSTRAFAAARAWYCTLAHQKSVYFSSSVVFPLPAGRHPGSHPIPSRPPAHPGHGDLEDDDGKARAGMCTPGPPVHTYSTSVCGPRIGCGLDFEHRLRSAGPGWLARCGWGSPRRRRTLIRGRGTV